jgi:hypothetical protein
MNNIDIRENDTIVIEFTKTDLEEWTKQYFKDNPRCRKIPLDTCIVRSLNKMLVITNRIVQNNYKQHYKNYTCFVVAKYGYKNLGISSADLNVHFTFPTKIRHDIDNYVGGCKEILDGFSESGLIVDDDYSHIKSLMATASYKKGVTKMTFTFNNCKFDLEELKVTQEKDKIMKAKKKATMAANKLKKKINKKKK